MYALMDIDTEEYISTFTSHSRVAPALEAYFNGDLERAKLWKTEDGAQNTLDRMYENGVIPSGRDVRVVEVDIW